jgi:hypothetical protein
VITATAPTDDERTKPERCSACGGEKNAPIACSLSIGTMETVLLCETCGRDAANVIGFMCIREGGWSKLEPRKRKAKS